MGRMNDGSWDGGDDGPSPVPEPDGRGLGEAAQPVPEVMPQPSTPGGGWPCEDELEFLATVEAIRAELAPNGPIEGLLTDRLIRAAWQLRRVAQVEAAGAFDEAILRYEALAERSLYRSMRALERCRARRNATGGRVKPPAAGPDRGEAEDPPAADRPEPACLTATPPEDVEDDQVDWFGRLSFDPNISEDSPVVRGTWVTVNHVISLIVDGWTWTDILRSHPELNEEDIRACLSYHVQEERGDPLPPG